MEITGKLIKIGEIQNISDKFQKREFVIETDEQYPQKIQLELQGKNCDVIDGYKIGQEVECSLNLRGRLWTNADGIDKYFNTIVCWKIQPKVQVTGNANTPATATNPKEVLTAPLGQEKEPDDLPF